MGLSTRERRIVANEAIKAMEELEADDDLDLDDDIEADDDLDLDDDDPGLEADDDEDIEDIVGDDDDDDDDLDIEADDDLDLDDDDDDDDDEVVAASVHDDIMRTARRISMLERGRTTTASSRMKSAAVRVALLHRRASNPHIKAELADLHRRVKSAATSV